MALELPSPSLGHPRFGVPEAAALSSLIPNKVPGWEGSPGGWDEASVLPFCHAAKAGLVREGDAPQLRAGMWGPSGRLSWALGTRGQAG